MLMGWFVLFMVLLTAVAVAAIIAIALVRPKRHQCASRVSDYEMVECSYQPLFRPPTNRKQKSSPHKPHKTETTVHGRIKTVYSRNLAGYAVGKELKQNSTENARNSVQSASAGWTVPRLVPSPDGGALATYCSVSVGIDGFASKNAAGMIRIGTESDWEDVSDVSNQQLNYAWFQVGERSPVMIVNFPINIGDKISAAIKRTDSKSGQCRLTIRNDTRGVAAVIPSNFTNSPHSDFATAMFLVEAHTEDQVLPLADFGAITFHECICTVDNVLAPVDASDRQATPIHMVNDTDQQILCGTIAATSNLSPDGKSFTVTAKISP
jgi:Peptidase A4 family